MMTTPVQSKQMKKYGTLIMKMEVPIISIDCSPDAKHIACGFAFGWLRIYDPNTVYLIGQIRFIDNCIDWVRSVKYSPIGDFIASTCGRRIKVWNAKTLMQVGTDLAGHREVIQQIAYSPDGQYLVSASDQVRIWNCSTFQQDGNSLIGHREIVFTVQYSPNSYYIISGSRDCCIIIWNSLTKKQVRKLAGHKESVLSIQYSFDSKLIVSGSGDKTIKLWNASSGQQIRQFAVHVKFVDSVVFSPNSQYIVSGSHDQRVYLWKVAQGRQVGGILHRHKSTGVAVAFSRDNKSIFSGSNRELKITALEMIKCK